MGQHAVLHLRWSSRGPFDLGAKFPGNDRSRVLDLGDALAWLRAHRLYEVLARQDAPCDLGPYPGACRRGAAPLARPSPSVRRQGPGGLIRNFDRLEVPAPGLFRVGEIKIFLAYSFSIEKVRQRTASDRRRPRSTRSSRAATLSSARRARGEALGARARRIATRPELKC